MAKVRFSNTGCPAGCWLTRDPDGKISCDCSGAFQSRLRGATGGSITLGKVIAATLFFAGAAGAGKLIANALR